MSEDGSIFRRQPVPEVVGCRRTVYVIAVRTILALGLVAHLIFGGAPVVYSPPVRGVIIDEHTGARLPGALVVGVWVSKVPLGGEYFEHGSEAVTDANGIYVLPGMPIRIRGFCRLFDVRDPELHFYKPGYVSVRLLNQATLYHPQNGDWSINPKRESYWNNKTVPLQPATGVKAEAEALGNIYALAFYPGKLRPQRFPLFWRTVIDGARRIPRGAYPPSMGDPQEMYDFHTKGQK